MQAGEEAQGPTVASLNPQLLMFSFNPLIKGYVSLHSAHSDSRSSFQLSTSHTPLVTAISLQVHHPACCTFLLQVMQPHRPHKCIVLPLC